MDPTKKETKQLLPVPTRMMTKRNETKREMLRWKI